ncbi:MAG: S9 family peptidase, partial [Pseudomonadota bacterium]
MSMVWRVSIVVLVSLLFAAPAAAQEGELRPVSHEEVWLMKRLGSPVVGPDGQHAVVSVTEPSYEADDDVSDLWLITIDGSEPPRRLTATASGESGVDWRPDGGA